MPGCLGLKDKIAGLPQRVKNTLLIRNTNTVYTQLFVIYIFCDILYFEIFCGYRPHFESLED